MVGEPWLDHFGEKGREKPRYQNKNDHRPSGAIQEYVRCNVRKYTL